MNEISIGSHTIVLDNNVDGADDDDLSGIVLSYQRAITKYVAIKGSYFSDEHDDDSDLEAKGFEANILIGTNFTSQGVYAFAGIGYFDESWEYSDYDVDIDFKGLQFSLGVGYRWEHIFLDLIISIRDPGDYEDLLNDTYGGYLSDSIDVTATSGALSLGVRF